MTGIQTWSVTAANNVNANTGVNWDEGMAPGTVNNSARQNMADLRAAFNDLIWFSYGKGDLAYTPIYLSASQYQIAGVDVSAAYHVGRRTKVVGPSTGTIYGTISAVSFSTNTTVTVSWDSGALSNEAFTAVYLSQVPVTGSPVNSMRLPTRQVLTSGILATYTTPSGVRQLRIRMVGGGGAGGSGGNSASDGGAGGNTIFNSINASGGGAGSGSAGSGNSAGGGSGGSGSASFRLTGSSGVAGPPKGNAGGLGGPGPWGGCGGSRNSDGIATAAPANTGGGGGGGMTQSSSTSSFSGSGGGGGEYVEIVINSPAASYTYTIGAGGAAASAGTNGTAGAAGGSGLIIVDEFY